MLGSPQRLCDVMFVTFFQHLRYSMYVAVILNKPFFFAIILVVFQNAGRLKNNS